MVNNTTTNTNTSNTSNNNKGDKIIFDYREFENLAKGNQKPRRGKYSQKVFQNIVNLQVDFFDYNLAKDELKIDKFRLDKYMLEYADKIIGDDFQTIQDLPYHFNGKYWEMIIKDKDLWLAFARKFQALFETKIDEGYATNIYATAQINNFIARHNSWDWEMNFSDIVSIPFLNGTLFINLKLSNKVKAEYKFKQGNFYKDKNHIFCINENFTDEMMQEGYWRNSFIGNYLIDYYQEDLEKLQQYLASILIPQFEIQQALLIKGEGGDGKGTLVECLQKLFPKVITSLDVSKWNASHDTTMLLNSICNVTSEAPSREISIDTFKSIVATDTIAVNPKFKDNFNFKPFCKQIITVNTMPKIEIQKAVLRRFVLIQTYKSTSIEERTYQFKEDFFANKDKLISFMLQGLIILKQNRFKNIHSNPELEKELVTINNSTIDDYLNDCIRITNNVQHRVSSDKLFETYKKWCSNNIKTNKADLDIKKETFSKKFGNVLASYSSECQNVKTGLTFRNSEGKTCKGIQGIEIIEEDAWNEIK